MAVVVACSLFLMKTKWRGEPLECDTALVTTRSSLDMQTLTW